MIGTELDEAAIRYVEAAIESTRIVGQMIDNAGSAVDLESSTQKQLNEVRDHLKAIRTGLLALLNIKPYH